MAAMDKKPIKKALDLAASMKKAGMVGEIAMGKPKEMDEPEMDDKSDSDSYQDILADMDHLVPGLGSLMQELCDRLESKDKEQDMHDLGEEE